MGDIDMACNDEFSTREHYRELAKSDNPTVRVGRNAEQSDKEPDIWMDICTKLDFRDGGTILDVGCGSGIMASNLIRLAEEKGSELYLIDDPAVISRLSVPTGVHVMGGYFLEEIRPEDFKKPFDRILAYSLLHVVRNPWEFVFHLASLLGEGGRLLVGDIPNQSLRVRMLTSVEGSNFHRRYRGEPPGDEPVFRTVDDYHSGMRPPCAEGYLDDSFMVYVILRLRSYGYGVYWMQQPAGLPFSRTREDLLICRPSYK